MRKEYEEVYDGVTIFRAFGKQSDVKTNASKAINNMILVDLYRLSCHFYF
jgi:hypothetical protein